MIYRYLYYRGLFVGVFLVAAPVFDVLAGSASAGMVHLLTAVAGAALLAVSISAGNRREERPGATMPTMPIGSASGFSIGGL